MIREAADPGVPRLQTEGNEGSKGFICISFVTFAFFCWILFALTGEHKESRLRRQRLTSSDGALDPPRTPRPASAELRRGEQREAATARARNGVSETRSFP